MIPRIPFIFTDGEKLSFSKISNNLIRMWSDLKYSRDRNITKSSFIVDFTGITTADTVSTRTFVLSPPSEIEILNTEIEVYSSGTASTVSIVDNSGDMSISTSVSATIGNRGYSSVKQNSRIIANSARNFVVSLTNNVSSIKFTVSYSSQRINKKNFLSSLPVFEMANTLSSLITKLNANLALYASEVSTNSLANTDLRIVVYPIINNTAAAITKSSTRIPSNLRRIALMKSNIVMAAGSTIQIQLLDETGAIVSAINAPGAGVSTIATVSNIVNDTQSVDNPTSSASDYTLNISRTLGVATINNSHVVLYYT